MVSLSYEEDQKMKATLAKSACFSGHTVLTFAGKITQHLHAVKCCPKMSLKGSHVQQRHVPQPFR
jgi:hypothetical protein